MAEKPANLCFNQLAKYPAFLLHLNETNITIFLSHFLHEDTEQYTEFKTLAPYQYSCIQSNKPLVCHYGYWSVFSPFPIFCLEMTAW